MNTVNTSGSFLEDELFPIRTVSKITGVNSVTLRAWERRYGLITPKRTETGHRLYSQEDINMIQQAQKLLEAGSSISHISRQLKSSRSFENLLVDQPSTIWQEYQERMIDAIVHFDEETMDAVYQESLSFHAIGTVTNELIIPLLQKLGERWENTQIGSVAEEHFFSVYLRNKLGAQYHHKRGRNNGPLLLASCMPGENHEFALLLFGLIAHENNYRTIILGADMPLDEMPYVVNQTEPDAVVLSCNKNCDFNASTIQPLSNIKEIPIFVGGNITDEQKRVMESIGGIQLDENYQRTIDIINNKLSDKINKA